MWNRATCSDTWKVSNGWSYLQVHMGICWVLVQSPVVYSMKHYRQAKGYLCYVIYLARKCFALCRHKGVRLDGFSQWECENHEPTFDVIWWGQEHIFLRNFLVLQDRVQEKLSLEEKAKAKTQEPGWLPIWKMWIWFPIWVASVKTWDDYRSFALSWIRLTTLLWHDIWAVKPLALKMK